jgi:hypothetical protein
MVEIIWLITTQNIENETHNILLDFITNAEIAKRNEINPNKENKTVVMEYDCANRK